MKKFIVLAAVLCSVFYSAFADVNVEFGIGSGYVFYGDEDLRDMLSDFDSSGQIIACADADFEWPLGNSVSLSLGADSILDARWHGSNHIILWDYCGIAGFTVFPSIAGLFGTVQYCLGRRTDFISFRDSEDTITSTKPGNGFAFGFGYDFSHDSNGFAPVISASWRHMPRGNDESDDIIQIKFRLKSR